MRFIWVALVVFFVLLMVWWSYYKYQDCLKVGHSVLYCVGKLVEGH